MGWGFLAILLITGLPLLASHGFEVILSLKLALVLLFALVKAGLTRRPARGLIFANFALVLIIVVLSGLLVRI
jgi:hypothetical protein